VVGKPAVEVVRETHRLGADLVMAGAGDEGRAGVSPLAFGVVRTAACAVWIVASRDGAAAGAPKRVLVAVDPAAPEEGDDPLHLRAPFDPARGQLDQAILRTAHALAEGSNAQLHVVHAWSARGEELLRGDVVLSAQQIDEYVEAARETHARALEGLLAQFPEIRGSVHVHMIKGRAADVILDQAQALRPDLVVMGTVVRTGLHGILMGNTAETVIRQAQCSILALKPSGFVSPVQVEGG
jgi:nucleotide-binding universal stress UspA family protein